MAATTAMPWWPLAGAVSCFPNAAFCVSFWLAGFALDQLSWAY